jgi:hypothetical protein
MSEVFKKIEKCFTRCFDLINGDNSLKALLISLKNNISIKDKLVNLEKYQSAESKIL